MSGPAATETDSVPEGTVRRGAITRHSVPKEELPASRTPLTGGMAEPLALNPLPVESEEVREAVALMGRWKACSTWREKLPLTLRHDRSEQFMQFFSYLHRPAGGGLQLDWDSFAGMSDLGRRDIRERRPGNPVLVRGHVSDEIINHFRDSVLGTGRAR